MGFGEWLDAATPIVRGQCTKCGFSRNIWVSELGEGDIKCDHRNRGCVGVLVKAYVGPKSGLPRHLTQKCSCPDVRNSSVGSCSAAASSSSCCAAQLPEDHEEEECPICTEPIQFADAAMRCRGTGGKRHYFHETCLTGWIRQCREDGRQPDCPSCRGPLQVHKRRLGEFLQTHRDLGEDDRRELERFYDCEGDEDEEGGWFSIDKETLIRGAMIAGAVLAVGAVAHGIFKVLQDRKKDNDRRRS